MELTQKILKVQGELKAPKGQFNAFGKYKYRSCEDILEAVKPLLVKNNLLLTITDDIALIGDRFYIKSTANITDGENSISVSAYARESLDKKGMDTSQITGATSSYARKYALNGLFLIDDTKDADTMDNTEQPKPQPKSKPSRQLEDFTLEEIKKFDKETLDRYEKKVKEITKEQYLAFTKTQKENIRNYYGNKNDVPFMEEEEFYTLKNWTK